VYLSPYCYYNSPLLCGFNVVPIKGLNGYVSASTDRRTFNAGRRVRRRHCDLAEIESNATKL